MKGLIDLKFKEIDIMVKQIVHKHAMDLATNRVVYLVQTLDMDKM